MFGRIGLDPEKETPGRQVVRFKGESLVAAMELALKDGGPGAAQLVAAEWHMIKALRFELGKVETPAISERMVQPSRPGRRHPGSRRREGTGPVAPQLGEVTGDSGRARVPEFSILTTASVLFDAVYVTGGDHAAQWASESDAVDFVREAYKHCKAVMATGDGVRLLEAAHIPIGAANGPDPADDATVIAKQASGAAIKRFIAAIARHRLWSRQPELHLPL